MARHWFNRFILSFFIVIAGCSNETRKSQLEDGEQSSHTSEVAETAPETPVTSNEPDSLLSSNEGTNNDTLHLGEHEGLSQALLTQLSTSRSANQNFSTWPPYIYVEIAGYTHSYGESWTLPTNIAVDNSYTEVEIVVYNLGDEVLSLSSLRAEYGLEISSSFSRSSLNYLESGRFRVRIKRDNRNYGWYSGAVNFRSNAQNAPEIYNIYIDYYIEQAPLISVSMGQTKIAQDASLLIGDKVPIDGSYVTRTITVKNEGTYQLNLDSSIVLTGGFELTQELSRTWIFPGSSATFEVGFRQGGRAPGQYQGRVSIYSTDYPRNPFQFLLTAEVPDRSWGFRKWHGEFFTSKPMIEWIPSFGAQSYDILVATNANCYPPYANQYLNVTGTTIALSQGLQHGNYFLCGTAKANGAPNFAATVETIVIQENKMFRALSDNGYTTWFPMEHNTFLLHFDEDFVKNGSLIKDSSANPQHAIFQANWDHNHSRNGKLENALWLSAGRTGVILPNTNKLSPEGIDFSVGFWTYPRDLNGNRIIYEDFGARNQNTIKIWIDNGGQLNALIRSDNNQSRTLRYNTRLTVNQWAHVFLTNNNHAAHLYVNGKIVAASTSAIGNILMAGGDAPYIGGHAKNNSTNKYDGFIDEFAFWRTGLNADQIWRLFYFQNTHHNRNNPIRTWHTQGDKIFDATNPENHGYDAGAELQGDFTVAFSVRPDNIQPVTQHAGNYMIGKFLGGQYYTFSCVFFNQTHALHGKFYCMQLRIAGGTERVTVTSPIAINDGNFHHITLVKSGTRLKLYVNGALVNTTEGALDNVWGRGPFVTGGRFVQDQFAGAMRNAKVYPKALSDATIANLAQSDR